MTLIHIDDLSSTWAQEYRRWRTLHKIFLACGGWFGTGHNVRVETCCGDAVTPCDFELIVKDLEITDVKT